MAYENFKLNPGGFNLGGTASSSILSGATTSAAASGLSTAIPWIGQGLMVASWLSGAGKQAKMYNAMIPELEKGIDALEIERDRQGRKQKRDLAAIKDATTDALDQGAASFSSQASKTKDFADKTIKSQRGLKTGSVDTAVGSTLDELTNKFNFQKDKIMGTQDRSIDKLGDAYESSMASLNSQISKMGRDLKYAKEHDNIYLRNLMGTH